MSRARFKLLLAKPPPPPIILPDLTLSSYSYSSVLAAGTDFATISGNSLGASLTLAAVDPADAGKVALTVDQGALEVGSVSSTTGTYEYELTSTLDGAANSPHTQRIALTVTPATLTPIINDISLPMGTLTPPGMGTTLLKNTPGLVDPASPQIVSWRMGSVTAGSGGLATDLGSLLTTNTPFATARWPTTTRGANNEVTTNRLPGASYTVPLIAVGEDGSEATCTVTITPVAGAVSRGDKLTAWPDADRADVIQSRLATKLGGLKLLISVGHVEGALYTLTGLTQEGRVTVEYADPERPCRIGGADFYRAARVSLLNVGIGGMQANKILVRESVEFYASGNYPLGASVADVLAINPASQAAIKFTSGSNDGLVENNHFGWSGRGCEFGNGVARSRVVNNIFEHYYGDLCLTGETTDCEFVDNLGLHPHRMVTSKDHIDGGQFADPPAGGGTLYITRFKFSGNIIWQGAGDTGSIGFHNGSTQGIDCEICRNIFGIRAGNAMQLGRHSGAVVTDNTIFLTASGAIANNSRSAPKANENDNIFDGVITLLEIGVGSSGTNILNDNLTVGSIQAPAATWSHEGNVALGLSYPAIHKYADDAGENLPPKFKAGVMAGRTNDFSNVFAVPNAFEKLNNYYDGDDPDVIGSTEGTDWANISPASAKALILATLTPIADGAADLGGGAPKGAINFDGSQKAS